jgi:hypothetical protein
VTTQPQHHAGLPRNLGQNPAQLAAVGAEAEPEVWTRARARLEAERRVPGAFGWFARPQALALSIALFAASVTLSWGLVSSRWAMNDDDASLAADAQVAFETGSVESLLPAAAEVASAPGSPSDSGGSR